MNIHDNGFDLPFFRYGGFMPGQYNDDVDQQNIHYCRTSGLFTFAIFFTTKENLQSKAKNKLD